MTTLSIIIPTWNTAQITLKCVDTINKHLPKNYAQIIIVDNGSTDNTADIFSKRKDLVYIRNSTNLGFSKANNIGALKADSKYLLFLNSDMELVDDTLVSMVDFLEQNPAIGLIGPRFLNPDLTPQGSVFPPQTPLNAIKEYWLNQSGSYTKYIPESTSPLEVFHVSGGAVLLRKSDFQKLGGWDERYFFFYEDHELCRQIHNLGLSIYYFPACRVIHRHGASGTKIADPLNQWRRLIRSSIIYNGVLTHYTLFVITWSSQKAQKLFKFFSPNKK